MKLGPILYSEAAKTPSQAIERDIGLFVNHNATQGSIRLIFFSTHRLQDIAEKYVSGRTDRDMSRMWPEEKEHELMDEMGAKSVIVATIDATTNESDLWNVSTSAAVNKFGPAIYDILMAAIYPAWLASDTSLTEGSRKVWNTFLQRKDVEHKLLTDWGISNFKNGLSVAKLGYDDHITDLRDALANSSTGEIPEEALQRFFENLTPEQVLRTGPLYAYRKQPAQTAIGSYEKLIQIGEDALEEVAGAMDLDMKHVVYALKTQAAEFFSKMYMGA